MAAQTAILVAICLGSLASAQLTVNNPRGNSAAEPPARHSVSGTVLNASTGEPLSKALVKLDTPSGQFAAFTDPSGHFSLEHFSAQASEGFCLNSVQFANADLGRSAVF